MVIRYIFPRLGMLYQEKSGNPEVKQGVGLKFNLDFLPPEKTEISFFSLPSSELLMTSVINHKEESTEFQFCGISADFGRFLKEIFKRFFLIGHSLKHWDGFKQEVRT
jgi:hypothetical protein